MKVEDIKIGMIATITKVSDDRYANDHPNGINPGFTIKKGIIFRKDDVIGVKEVNSPDSIRTSKINNIESIGETKFLIKTINSTYELEIFPKENLFKKSK